MIGLALWLACGGGPDALTYQESWELLGINTNGALLDARFSRTNTGVLRGQGHARIDWLFPRQTPIFYGRDALPRDTVVGETLGIQVGPDHILKQSGQWDLQVNAGEFDARIQLQEQVPGPGALHWDDQGESDTWTVASHVALGEIGGFLRAGRRDSVVQGHGALLTRHGTTPPGLSGTRRTTAVVLEEGLTIGIDQTGSRALAWAVVGPIAYDASTAAIHRPEPGVVELDFRPSADIVARLHTRKPHLRRFPWEHLTWLERHLVGLVKGIPVRRLQAARAEITVAGESHRAKGLVVVTDYE